MVAIANLPSPSEIGYAQSARAAGCPRDQMENFVRAGMVLQPKQLMASAAARLCDAPDGPTEIGMGGARGPGKSHWLLAQMAADDCQRSPGLKCLLLRKVGKANQENFDDFRRRALMGLDHRYLAHKNLMAFPNDSRIVLGHFQHEKDIDAYLGIEYDVIGVEEATTLTWAKYVNIRTCNRTSKQGWRPRIYATTNPGNIGHQWFKELFVEPYRIEAAGGARQSGTRFFPCTIDDNRFVNREYRDVLDKLTGWQYRAWRLGDWDVAAGQFFTTFRRDVHVIDPIDLPRGWRYWCALDYGFVHYTSCHLFAESGDGIVYVLDEHGEQGWLVERHVDAIKAMLARNGLQLSDLDCFVAGADVFQHKPHGGTISDDYRENGIVLRQANDDRINGAAECLARLGDVDAVRKDESGTPVAAPIDPSLYIVNRCAMLIETLPALQHNPRRPDDVLKVNCDEEGRGGDDFYDDFRYGLMEAATKRKVYVRPSAAVSLPHNTQAGRVVSEQSAIVMNEDGKPIATSFPRNTGRRRF